MTSRQAPPFQNQSSMRTTGRHQGGDGHNNRPDRVRGTPHDARHRPDVRPHSYRERGTPEGDRPFRERGTLQGDRPYRERGTLRGDRYHPYRERGTPQGDHDPQQSHMSYYSSTIRDESQYFDGPLPPVRMGPPPPPPPPMQFSTPSIADAIDLLNALEAMEELPEQTEHERQEQNRLEKLWQQEMETQRRLELLEDPFGGL